MNSAERGSPLDRVHLFGREICGLFDSYSFVDSCFGCPLMSLQIKVIFHCHNLFYGIGLEQRTLYLQLCLYYSVNGKYCKYDNKDGVYLKFDIEIRVNIPDHKCVSDNADNGDNRT